MATTNFTQLVPRVNLALFQQVSAQLTPEQKQIFAACFIGALSDFVSAEIWEMAIETASTSVFVLCPQPKTSTTVQGD